MIQTRAEKEKTMGDVKTKEVDSDAIERAILEARARAKEKNEQIAKLSPEERKKQQEEKKRQREAEREARRLQKQKEASERVPHMSKVERAAAKLPLLNQKAKDVFDNAIVNLSRDQLAALAMHIEHYNRVKATEAALKAKVTEGMTVRIVGGDPRYIGLVGTVAKAQRIRCYVDLPDVSRPVYLFTSDVEQIVGEPEEVQQATGTDGT